MKNWSYRKGALVGAIIASVLRIFLQIVDPTIRAAHVPIGAYVGNAIGGALVAILIVWICNKLIRPAKQQG